jgi:hypothetical protein
VELCPLQGGQGASEDLGASIATSSHVVVSVPTVAMASTDGSSLAPQLARTAVMVAALAGVISQLQRLSSVPPRLSLGH